MARSIRLSFLTLALALAGCAAGASAPPQIRAQDDQFKPYREFATPPVRAGVYPTAAVMVLAGQIDRQSGVLTTLLKVKVVYTQSLRHTFESARNNRAQPLRFIPVIRHGQCRVNTNCINDELFYVEIPEADLRQAPVTGYPLKVFARDTAEMMLVIGRPQITALFDQIDADRRLSQPPPPKKQAAN